MKRIGLMTWYHYCNYGTALQASAIAYAVRRAGYDAELIQYSKEKHPDSLRSVNASYITELLRNKWHEIRYPQYASEERSALFREYLSARVAQTEPCRTYTELNSLNNRFDAFICGSDQIWSPLWFDDKYFLSFVDNPDKMIAYAPSMGVSHIEEAAVRKPVSELIGRFTHLSVREKAGAELIRELCGMSAKVVLDPTLLLTAEEWDSYALSGEEKAGSISPDGYILYYFLGEYEKYASYVNKLSRRLGIPAYGIRTFRGQKGNFIPYETGPADFVELIKNARYVCTDSFHGLCFSVLYNIPFTIFSRFREKDSRNQNSRIYSLLELLKMENRLQSPKSSPNAAALLECDFSEADRLLDKARRDSLQYLENALELASSAAQQKEASQAVRREMQNGYTITQLCCGCGACSAVCARNAVTISVNENGFAHYKIDHDRCVGCGACRKVCPFCNVTAIQLDTAQRLAAFRYTNEMVLKESSSGGAAQAIIDACSDSTDYVCGSMYDKLSDSAVHCWVSPKDSNGINAFRGSKYIQSYSDKALLELMQFPKERRILFFGTPCQTAAADKLLRQRGMRDNAVLVDLVCHGVPSRLLWTKYKKEIELQHGLGEHPEVVFRRKAPYWTPRKILIANDKKRYTNSESKDNFYAFFKRGLADMPTCYECPYRERSSADIRIGDYWGERYENDKNGVSMVIAVSVKGSRILDKLEKDNIGQVISHPLEEYWQIQWPYNSSAPLFYDELLDELRNNNESLKKMRRRYCSVYDLMDAYKDVRKAVRMLLRRIN